MARNMFLWNFRKQLPAVMPGAMKAGVRRDMTIEELNNLAAVRKEAYEKNLEAGQFKYFVYDLEIRENKTPKPLNPRGNSR